jgi:deoxycytidine triphosphate deaminase
MHDLIGRQGAAVVKVQYHMGDPEERNRMSILTDTDLEPLIDSSGELVISPFNQECLTPVGYDLRIGKTYTTSDIKQVRRNLNEGESITLKPGTTALISTLEYVQMPKSRTVSGLIESRVSQVSKGLSHVSTTVDPDWRGHLLIAIHNHAVEEVKLKYGETFCTIVFLKNESPATRDSNKHPDRLDVFSQ